MERGFYGCREGCRPHGGEPEPPAGQVLLQRVPNYDVTAKVAAQELIRTGVFASFIRSNKDSLQLTKPGNQESYQVEWETVENMKVHYENVERHMLAVVIA